MSRSIIASDVVFAITISSSEWCERTFRLPETSHDSGVLMARCRCARRSAEPGTIT
jgi:hypothetical protein